ncbi:hypothetical protein [Chitinolyticbacter albus]|uniref:hypothetical protein n=1 Tax=Chitinolyticbacter albus TaxID=2961951 RepID=UPI00210C7C8F|nr:hypothetical protein [Chitinolyticbacter albus]
MDFLLILMVMGAAAQLVCVTACTQPRGSSFITSLQVWRDFCQFDVRKTNQSGNACVLHLVPVARSLV